MGDAVRMESGPVATHLLFENADVKVWQMNTPAGGTFWPHEHHHDYVLFYTTDVLATVYDAPEEHDRIWKARYERDERTGDERNGDRTPTVTAEKIGIMTHAESVFYIPGTGFLSPGFVNIGETPFIAPLIEVVRPRRPDQEGVGFARSDALVGIGPVPGRVHLLENDRVRVFEITLRPGESDAVGARPDAGVYVIDGGTVAREDAGHEGSQRSGEVFGSHEGHWRAAGTYALRNTGSTIYRELCVELK